MRPGAQASAPVIDSFTSALNEWPVRSVEALTLIDEYCEVMSPLRAIENLAPAFSPETTSFLRFTSVEVWNLRNGIPALIAVVREAHRLGDAAFARWQRDGSASALQSLAEAGDQLARALAKLPQHTAL
jgi:hypothetical protein